jgi:hypothetical protein
MNNPGIAANLKWYNKTDARFPAFNPSAADSAAMQAALVSALKRVDCPASRSNA